MLHDSLAKAADLVGMVGVILLLMGYYLISVSRISSGSIKYHLLNFAGAGFILFSLMFSWNTSAVVVEVAWMIISLLGLYKITQRKKQINEINNIYTLNTNKLDVGKL